MSSIVSIHFWKIDRKIERETFADMSLQCKKKVFLSFFRFNNLYACLVMKIVKKHITSTNHVHFNNNAAIVWHAIGWDVAILAYPSFVHKFQYNVQDHYNLKNCNQTFWEWECSRYFWRYLLLIDIFILLS